MEKRLAITIHLEPAVWRLLRKHYADDGKAIDIAHSWIYYLVLRSLENEQVVSTREVERASKRLEAGRIYITSYAAMRYGTCLRPTREALISRTIFRHEREKICYAAAALAATGTCSRSAALQHFLLKADLMDEDLSYDTLKKHYQRHCRQFEEDIRQYINEITE